MAESVDKLPDKLLDKLLDKPFKHLITSTGRSGTTFLILLYIMLGQPCNYNRETYADELKRFYISNCGLEGNWSDAGVFIKNPKFLTQIAEIWKHTQLRGILFPYRNFVDSAQSRANLSKRTPNGGLWNATDVPSQVAFYNRMYKIFLLDVTRYQIPVIYIDFDRLIRDPIYTYERLKSTFLPGEKGVAVSVSDFILAYYQATDIHHRLPPRKCL